MSKRKMKSPDPDNKPIITCIAETCDDCPVDNTLHCHFTARDLMRFFLIVSPSFLLGGVGIYYANSRMLVPWLVIIIGFFGFIEIRAMCSHCPHYAEPDRTLRCWANYGSPKLWKYRPGPMTSMEKVVFGGGFLIVWGYPLVFLLISLQWFLLIVYVLACVGFFIGLRIFFCSQCMNFACPLNAVQHENRRLFFDRNPDIANAWDADIKR
jgi:hypothetical protein